MEDTLEHFNVRFFGTQYSFEFGRPDGGARVKTTPALSDSALRRLVRGEIQGAGCPAPRARGGEERR